MCDVESECPLCVHVHTYSLGAVLICSAVRVHDRSRTLCSGHLGTRKECPHIRDYGKVMGKFWSQWYVSRSEGCPRFRSLD